MKVIMTCGGTGGHIYPAIAIADKIKSLYEGSEIIFIGTKKGMENRLVPSAGYKIYGIDASGIDRHNPLNNFKTVKNMISGSMQAKAIIKDFAPDIVIGTGGYVTGMVVRAAAKLGIKTYIHEQNAFPGVANKMLEKFTEKVFISFPEAESFFKDKSKVMLVGNPVRDAFINYDKAECRKTLGISESERVLLICGGSLGAEMVNKAALELISQVKTDDLKVIFVTGRRYYEDIKAKVSGILGAEKFVNLIDYADNMPVLMGASDLIVSRAGAITLSEILAMNKPAIFIPSPNVTGNHQYHNAKSVEDAGAAVLLEEKVLNENISELANKVFELFRDNDKLLMMSAKAKLAAKTDAADVICDNLWKNA